MKKIFTLFMALGLFIAADAQRGVRPNKGRVGVNVSVNNRGLATNSFAADRLLRQEIARINFKFDRKVQQVRNSFFMGRVTKIRKIRSLELQRQHEINHAYARVRLNGNRYGHTRRY